MSLFSILYILISIACIVIICRRPLQVKAKLAWIALVIVLPFGAFLYFFVARPRTRRWAIGVYVALASAFFGLYALGYRWYAFPSSSMFPTIKPGEHVIGRIDASYGKRMKRFDLVIHRSGQGPNQTLFASRVVGLPGDHVVIKDNKLSVNGEFIRLLPVMPENIPIPKECDVKLQENTFFVLGDNPEVSLDSRALGPISFDNLAGYLVFRK